MTLEPSRAAQRTSSRQTDSSSARQMAMKWAWKRSGSPEDEGAESAGSQRGQTEVGCSGSPGYTRKSPPNFPADVRKKPRPRRSLNTWNLASLWGQRCALIGQSASRKARASGQWLSPALAVLSCTASAERGKLKFCSRSSRRRCRASSEAGSEPGSEPEPLERSRKKTSP